MKIEITYEHKAAEGTLIRTTIIEDFLESANDVCNRIAEVGYKLIDVTRVE